jgi:inosine-uridine nucleoside N-ribohydrolase
MIDLIYDCDITMGLPGKDVDDGLALLYLVGSAKIRLLGVTSTFGNSTIEDVHPCLLSILNDLDRSTIPAYRGAARTASEKTAPAPRADSDAARFLAETIHQNPGTVSVLATGSPTNLLGAYQLHPGFFQDVREIVFMGGIVEPLLVNGQEMAELNFASDPEAALYALYRGQPPLSPFGTETPSRSLAQSARCNLTVISGNLCLQALLTDQWQSLPAGSPNPGTI